MKRLSLTLWHQNKLKVLIASILFWWAPFATSCVTFGKTTCPYELSCTSVLASEDNSYEYAGVDYVFCNLSDKVVSSFTIVFYIYDDDGNPAGTDSNCIRTVCQKSVAPQTELAGSIELDADFSAEAEVPYDLDFVHVSEINYADGSTWRDLFGWHAF